MDFKNLLAKLAQLRQNNASEQSTLDETSRQNSESIINPSMFKANKQQELKGIPQEDIQDVVSQTQDYMDPRVAEMATMSGGISNIAKTTIPKIAPAFEKLIERIKGTNDEGITKTPEILNTVLDKVNRSIIKPITNRQKEVSTPNVGYIADDVPVIPENKAEKIYQDWKRGDAPKTEAEILKEIEDIKISNPDVTNVTSFNRLKNRMKSS